MSLFGSSSWPAPESARTKAEREILELRRNLLAIEFVELRVYDIHGFAKGRILSTCAAGNVFEEGTGLAGLLLYAGVKGQINFHPDLWKGMNHDNYRLVPIMDTLKPCLKAVAGGRNMATVLCELRLPDGSVDMKCPRQCAMAQLRTLRSEFGLEVKSAFEAEFNVIDRETKKPLANHYSNWTSLAIMELAQEELVNLTAAMEEIGVKIDSVQTEYGTGKFEVTFPPEMGIEAADMVAGFKTSSFVYLQKRGYDIDFMSCSCPPDNCNSGFHYNISIWDEDGTNILVDAEDPRKLSKLGRQWLAGLIEHSPAMLALCSPTINCYRRIGSPFAPTFANWALNDRSATFRLKIEAGANVYVENRLPGSACNPYLVLASTVAAGMDGIRRKLDLPEPGDESKRLPATLEEALEALEADGVLREALGEDLVKMFLYTKRTFEVEEFKAFGDITDEEKLLKEKEYYYLPL